MQNRLYKVEFWHIIFDQKIEILLVQNSTETENFKSKLPLSQWILRNVTKPKLASIKVLRDEVHKGYLKMPELIQI